MNRFEAYSDYFAGAPKNHQLDRFIRIRFSGCKAS